MQYYNRSTNSVVQSLPDYATEAACRDYGYWPIYTAPFEEDPRFYTSSGFSVEFNEYNQTYTQHWIPVLLPLECIKAEKEKDFVAAFAEIDVKSARGDRGSVLAIYETVVEGHTISPEAVQDINILWELESVASENRALLIELNALNITEEMTSEETQAVLDRAMAIKPWIPWNPAAPIETPEAKVEIAAKEVRPLYEVK